MRQLIFVSVIPKENTAYIAAKAEVGRTRVSPSAGSPAVASAQESVYSTDAAFCHTFPWSPQYAIALRGLQGFRGNRHDKTAQRMGNARELVDSGCGRARVRTPDTSADLGRLQLAWTPRIDRVSHCQTLRVVSAPT